MIILLCYITAEIKLLVSKTKKDMTGHPAEWRSRKEMEKKEVSSHLKIPSLILRARLLLLLTHRPNTPGQQPPRVKDVEHRNSSNHHRPIKRNKVPLRGNQIPRPALRELNRPINTPHINTQNREDHRPKQQHDRPLHIPQQFLAQRASYKIRRADHEHRDRE